MKSPRFLAICFLLTSLAPAIGKELPCKPEKWQAAIEKFAAADLENPPAQEGIVFVGSSSIVLWKLPESFPDLNATNRGFGGSEICDSTHYLETLVIKHHPRIVVFYAGDNDIARGKTAEQVHHDFLAFQEKLFTALPDTRLLYVAIKPSRSRWQKAPVMAAANELIAAECESSERMTFIDIWTPMVSTQDSFEEEAMPPADLFIKDGLHLSAKGYDLWNSILEPHLQDDK
ncbi:MAG: hypothetical protein KDA57_06010 [Planctomycetales bacterium]|nr:hypothetical protein [Planctomycetales bacterium]